MSTNTREYMRQYMQKYRASGRATKTPRHVSATRQFVGCDGEGATLPNGYHAYFMLRIGDQTLRPKGNNVRLTTIECLDFIARQDPKKIYVGYFFDYDATKILEDLPWEKLDRLMNRAKRTGINGQLFPVDYLGFQIEYLPRKELKVRRMLGQTETETEWSPWVVISDVGTFFQASFLSTIQAWEVGTEDEHEKIRVGKHARAEFDVKDFDDIAEYNALEIRLLEQLMAKFRDACISAGYVPTRWQGPGLLAETMLRTHGVPKSADVPLLNDSSRESLLTFGRSAYYGGRFEVACIGPVTVPLGQYDINSAYPHAMRVVPCLMHGEWEYVDGSDTGLGARFDSLLRGRNALPTGRKGESFALCFGRYYRRAGQADKGSLWYGLPNRSKTGTISFPESGQGWYWSFEIASAKHQQFSPESMWVYTRTCTCRPLGFVEKVYEERQRIGKDGPGKILKLGLNSLYGKTVQSIGSPKYSNPIWASFITAIPRTMIQNFIHSSPCCKKGKCGTDIVMVATDSVATMTDRSNDVEISMGLGAWSLENHPTGMFIVQPGVYFGSSNKPTKTRGFTRTVVDQYAPQFTEAYQRLVSTGKLDDGGIKLPVKTFVGIRYALQRRNSMLLGQWIDYGGDTEGKVMSFDWTSKRMPMAVNPTAQRPWLVTFPYPGDPAECTVPYSKDIGGLLTAEESRMVLDAQPDWSRMVSTYE